MNAIKIIQPPSTRGVCITATFSIQGGGGTLPGNLKRLVKFDPILRFRLSIIIGLPNYIGRPIKSTTCLMNWSLNNHLLPITKSNFPLVDLHTNISGACPDLWDPILSFSHTWSRKSSNIRGLRPLMGPHPLREIMNLPLLTHHHPPKKQTPTLPPTTHPTKSNYPTITHLKSKHPSYHLLPREKGCV